MVKDSNKPTSGDSQQPWDDSEQLPAQFIAMRRKSKRIKRVKYIAVAVIAVAVCGGGAYAFTHAGAQEEQPTAQTYTQTVETGTLNLSVEGSGTLAAASTTNANASVSGTVKKVYVKQGDSVKKGDTLFTLTSDTLSDAVESASSSASKAYSSYSSSLSDLSSAKAKLAKAKKAYAAAKKKAKKNSSKSSTASNNGAGDVQQSSASSDQSSAVQSAQEAVTQAEQNVTQAKSSAEQAKSSYEDAAEAYDDAVEALDDLTVKAASSGTVTAVSITKGDAVSESSDTAAVTISNLSKMSIAISVSEYEIGNIKTGQKATVSVTALDKDLDASVTSVSSSASDSQEGSTAYYSVSLEIAKPSSDMLEGMSATAKVVYQSYEDALLVPASAVSTQGDTSSVTVQDSDGSTRQVEVEVLGSDDETSAVSSSSLAQGDQVVVSYQVDTSGSDSQGSSAAGIMGMAGGGQGSGDAKQGGGQGADPGAGQGGGQEGPGGSGDSGSAPTPPSGGGGQGGGMPGGSGSSQG